VTELELSLPRFELEADLAAAVDAIRQDSLAGPIELARYGADVVLRLTNKAHYERPLQIALEVRGLARALLEARPECMPIVNLASETARPLPELYGRGKAEGARMRGDLRARIEAWLARLDERAARIDAQRAWLAANSEVVVVTAVALDGKSAFFPPGTGVCSAAQRYVVAGAEKFVPPNYPLSSADYARVPLEDWTGVLTGDSDEPQSPKEVRRGIASLRFETSLL
jgi:hypothetical protein